MADVQIQWCDKGKNHAGPFFTVFAVALLSGPATRGQGKKRVRFSKRVSRLCRACLSKVELQFQGSELLAAGPRDTAQDG